MMVKVLNEILRGNIELDPVDSPDECGKYSKSTSFEIPTREYMLKVKFKSLFSQGLRL